jgi:hypothetical protein
MIRTRTTERARALAGSGRWTWALLATALALVSGGCDDDEERAVSCPCGSATLSGRLLNDAGPVAGHAWVRPTNWEADPCYTQAETDQDGRFELTIPAGTYRLQAAGDAGQVASGAMCYFAAEGPTLSEAEADTFVIRAGEVYSGLDFRFGRVKLTAYVPAELAGWRASLGLEPGSGFAPEGLGWAYEIMGEIEGGTMVATWPAVVPGTYRASLGLEPTYPYPDRYSYERVRLLAAPDEDPNSDRLVVEPIALVSHAATLPDPPPQLSVDFAGASHELGAGTAFFTVFAADSSVAYDAYLDDEGGSFLLKVHSAGTMRLSVAIGGVQRWVGGTDFAHATQFELGPGTVIEDITIADCGLRVGLVGAGPRMEGGVWLTLHARADGALVARIRRGLSWGCVQTIQNLSPGEYLLRVEPAEPFLDDWAPQWYNRASSMASATPITLDELGDIAQVTVALQPGGVIQGVVDRAPLREDRTWCIVATTAEDADPLGSLYLHAVHYDFALRGLPDGDYRIGAWIYTGENPNEPTDVTWYPGTPDWDAASVVSIREAGTVSGIDFALPR